jgi:hypothetical protein
LTARMIEGRERSGLRGSDRGVRHETRIALRRERLNRSDSR